MYCVHIIPDLQKIVCRAKLTDVPDTDFIFSDILTNYCMSQSVQDICNTLQGGKRKKKTKNRARNILQNALNIF